MREAVQAVVDAILARTPRGANVPIDALGDAVGAMAISQDEIDAIIAALEAEGRTVAAEPMISGEATLARVLEAARTAKVAHGRAPTAKEIADATGMPLERVRNALALARVIAR